MRLVPRYLESLTEPSRYPKSQVMANEPLPLSQPEIEEVKGYRHVLDQKHRFCDESSVGFFEVCGKQKVNFEELGTERLLEKLRTGASGESRRGRRDGDELRIRVLYVQNSLLSFLFSGCQCRLSTVK
jgi:hypothetical protein